MGRGRVLPAGCVAVWIVSLADGDDPSTVPVEDRDDLAREGQILVASRRRLFRFRRIALRRILARVYPEGRVLARAAGAPVVDGARGRLEASTSASGAIAAVALADGSVGIDVEATDGAVDMVGIVDFVAARPGARRDAVPDALARHGALMAWTRLEAGLKRSGHTLHGCIVGDPPGDRAAPPGGTVVIANLDYVCSVTHSASPCPVSLSIEDFKDLHHAS